MTDYHVHPDFSHDARGTPGEYCERAVALGLDEVCFTTHYEPDPTRFGFEHVRVRGRKVRPDSDWPVAYFAALEECRRRFPGLVIRAGVEVGYEMGLEGAMSDMLGRYPFDFVLGAVHLLDHVAVTASAELDRFRSTLKSRGAGYVAGRNFDYLRAAAGSGLFDCIAHLDIWRKYVVPEMGDEFGRAVAPLIRPMLDEIARAGIGLEVNTSALRRGDSEPYPAWSVVEQAVAAGITVFTVGSDAHQPEDLGAGIPETERTLARLGISPARFHRRRVVTPGP